jgi:hypothetical protein
MYPQELFSNHVIVMAENDVVNPLNADLNSICHLLSLLGAHPILHISRIRVNMLHFESEIILSVSVIVPCLGVLASLWRAH